MDIQIKGLPYMDILDLLNLMSPQFKPSLSETLNLEEYADKLSKNAMFLICYVNDLVKGSIVFYPNHLTSILYIPLVWVDMDFRGFGIAKEMFGGLIQFGKNEGLSNLDLEVLKDNNPAKSLYDSLGFSILEERPQKYLMRLKI